MASISLAGALLVGSGISAVGGVTNAALGANAAETAAGEEEQAAEQALQFQEQVYQQEQQNQAPFLEAGQTSIGALTAGLQNGTFGPGSLPAVPAAPGAFVPPTLAQAEATPGYEFQQQQGAKGILEASAASGGAISGGTAKSLENFNQNLAQTDYGNVYNQALQGYAANLSQYGSQLAGYQTAQGVQAQEFNQLAAPAQIGEGAATNLTQAGTASSQNVAQLMTQLGQAQAAGTVGSTNAITQGISSTTSGINQDLLLGQILPLLISGGTPGYPGSAPVGTVPSAPSTGGPYGLPSAAPPVILPPSPVYGGTGAG